MSEVSREALEDGLSDLGLIVDSEARALMLRHLDLVRTGNEATNLTRITDPETMVRDHVLDSLAVLPALAGAGLEIPTGTRYLDIGTGAGFPGIPLTLARPDIVTTLAESRGPKGRFLETAVQKLELSERVKVLVIRARELHHHHPELEASFGLVTARAVSELSRVLREVKSIVAPGGLVIHYKGPKLDRPEREAGTRDATKYGFETLLELESPMPGRDRRFVIHRRGS